MPRNSCANIRSSAYYDEVAAKALMLAQADVNRGVLDPARQTRIRDAIKGLIENLSDRKDRRRRRALGELPADWRNKPVMCVAGRGPLDEAAALLLVDMLAQIWRRRRGWCRPTRPPPPRSMPWMWTVFASPVFPIWNRAPTRMPAIRCGACASACPMCR